MRRLSRQCFDIILTYIIYEIISRTEPPSVHNPTTVNAFFVYEKKTTKQFFMFNVYIQQSIYEILVFFSS